MDSAGIDLKALSELCEKLEKYPNSFEIVQFVPVALKAIPKLIEEVERLQAEKRSLHIDWRDSYVEVISERDSLTAAHTSCIARDKRYQDTIDSLKAEVERLECTKLYFLSRVKALHEERDSFKAEVERLLEDAEANNSYTLTLIHDFHKKKDALKAEVDQLTKDRGHYMQCTINRDATIEKLTLERDSLKGKLAKYGNESMCEKLTNDHTILEKERDSLKADLNACRCIRVQREKRLEVLEKERDAALARYEKLRQTILWSGSNDWTPPDIKGWVEIVRVLREDDKLSGGGG